MIQTAEPGGEPERSRTAGIARAGALTVVVLGVALRFALLDADPSHYEWIGYFTDEGRWTHQPRSRALFNHADGTTFEVHSLVAPVYQLASYAVFRAGGVGVASSRLLSAAAGSVVLVAFWLAFRSATTPEALFLALVPLALQTDLLTLSRLAVPEMTVIALDLLLYLAIMADGQSPLRRFGLGLAAFAAVGVKLTSIPAVAILSLLLLRQPRSPGEGRRWTGFLAFAAGAVVPALVLAAIALGCCGRELWPIAASTAHKVRSLVGIASAYDELTFPIENPLSVELDVWGLALWYAIAGWWVSPRDEATSVPRRHMAAALLWGGLYFVVMQASVYFPNRYKLHIFVPMCIAIAMGVGLLQRAGWRVESALAESRGVRRWLSLLFLALPSAAFAAPWVAIVAGMAGAESFRTRTKLLALMLSLAGLTLVVAWRCRARRPLRFVMVFPAVAALAWVGWERFGPAGHFWPVEGQPPTMGWLVLLLGAALASAFIAGARRPPIPLGAGVAISAAALAVFALVQLAPGYLAPHYTIRDTSRQIGTLLAGYRGRVGSSGGDGLFRENALTYGTIWDRRWPRKGPEPVRKPEVLVTVFEFDDPDAVLAREYCLIGEFPLFVSPTYYGAHPMESPTSALGQTARVYRRRLSSGCPPGPPAHPSSQEPRPPPMRARFGRQRSTSWRGSASPGSRSISAGCPAPSPPTARATSAPSTSR